MSANSSYSIRSFARDLGLPASTLSEVLNGKKGISPVRAGSLAKKLKLPDWQMNYFCDLAAKEHAKSPRVRADAEKRLKESRRENSLQLVKQSALRALTSWVDLAILELTYLKDFSANARWIAKKIGIEEAQAKSSMKRLRLAGLVTLDVSTGKWTDASPLFSTTDGVSNDRIRRFHGTALRLALEKLENPDVQSRVVKTVVFSLSKSDRKKAESILNEAVVKIVALADTTSNDREDVMLFSAQLFSLVRETKED